MRIAVIGETGQLARRLAAADSAHDRVFLARATLDLAKPETIAPALEAARPDLIVNAAAYTAVDDAEENRAAAFAINADGPGEAARIAAALDVPFVQVSTDYVYDGAKDGPYLETDPTAPLGVYGASKLAGEQAVLAACPRSVILRTAWVYAPEGKNFVKTMLRLGATHDTLRVVDDQRGCPTYAGDLAAAILDLAPRLTDAVAGDPAFGVFHATGGGEASWADFAEQIFAQATARGVMARAPQVTRIGTAEFPTKAARPRNSVLDCGKLADIHGLRLRHWPEALEDMLAQVAT